MDILEKYTNEAVSLKKLKKVLEQEYSEDMVEFLTRILQERFPEITDLDVAFYYDRAATSLNWNGGPNDEEMENFLNQLNDRFDFQTL